MRRQMDVNPVRPRHTPVRFGLELYASFPGSVFIMLARNKTVPVIITVIMASACIFFIMILSPTQLCLKLLICQFLYINSIFCYNESIIKIKNKNDK